MTNRAMVILGLLVLGLVMSTVIADEPVNLSLFDPETFQVQPITPDETMLSLMNYSASSVNEKGSGTGEKTISIMAEDSHGNVTSSEIFIGGTDETSWSYSSTIDNQSDMYYTLIQLQVSHASMILSESHGIASESREISRVYNRMYGDISGGVMIQTLIPVNDKTWLSGPLSIQQLTDLTGRSISASDEAYHIIPSGSNALTTSQLQEILADETARTSAGDISAKSAGNRSDTTIPSVLTSSGKTTETIGHMVIYDGGTLGYRYGLAASSPDTLLSSNRIEGLTATEVYQDLRLVDSTRDPVYPPANSFISGRKVTSGSYYGRIETTGGSGDLSEEYSYSASEFLERGVNFNDDRNILREEYLFPAEATVAVPAKITGDQTLSWKGSAASLTGSIDASGQKISHFMIAEENDSSVNGILDAGNEDPTSPVSLKGYVQSQVSSANIGSTAAQNLYYVDAGRGVPVSWETIAGRGEEVVKSTGSSTSGSRFVRQKAYSDRSTLTAL